MKAAVAVVIVFAATFVGADILDVYLESVKDPILECAKENGFTDMTPREIFDKETQMGVDGATCQRACTMKLLGMMKNAKLVQQSLDVFIKAVHAENPEKIPVLQKAASECLEKVKPLTDECKVAYVFIECFLDKH